jgi:hypothetical protein
VNSLGADEAETVCFKLTLTVLEPGVEKTPVQEWADDLLALIAPFASRLSRMCSRKQRALVDSVKQVMAEQEE